jgi:hypothetical protein
MVFFVISLVIFFMANFTIRDASITSSTPKPSSLAHKPSPNAIYGHIHMAKTGGTSINGNLSMHYERICGHKGYSYDAIETNERYRKNETHLWHAFQRGQVHKQMMEEIGYQDCDWISLETFTWDEWFQFRNWTIPMELHLPCRSPVDHLLSQCNWRKRVFDCRKTGNDMMRQIDKCLVYIDRRYDKTLADIFPVKCFDYRQTNEYLEWIGARLQQRRISTDYFFRETNKSRQKGKECVWNQTDVQELIETYLIENYDYYRFCDQCLGSERDLLVPPT